eukprot:COSAG02_NODE_1253_length_13598_cov_3.599526_6_plen_74_part_00
MIGGVSASVGESRSSVARLDGGVSLSLSRHPFVANDYYVGASEHLIRNIGRRVREGGSEPSFDKRNWSHIAAV